MRRIKLLVVALLCLGVTMPLAEGRAVDRYRDILLSGSYTIRYQNITPAPRITNRDRSELFGKSGLAAEEIDYFTRLPKKGVIVAAGDTRYEEIAAKDFTLCRLSRQNENYVFAKYDQKGKTVYSGSGKGGKITPQARNILAETLNGQSFGDEDMTFLLGIILPDKVKSAAMTKHEFVAAGNLDNGLAYEDYRAGKDSLVRYYFRGNQLIKIAAARYQKDKTGKRLRKCIILIDEFSDTPAQEYLNMPKGV